MRYFLCLIFILGVIPFSLEAADEAAPLANPSILSMHAIETEAGRKDVGFDVLPISGGAIISGSTLIKGGSVDGLLMHVDDQGKVLWRKVYGGAGLDLIFSAHPDGAGGFVCVGFKSPTGDPDMKAMDGWILRIDSNGNITWEHTYGGSGEDRLTGIRKIQDGWIAVGHNETDGRYQAWVLRVDEKGNEVNSWTYDSALPTKGLDVLPLPDGGFVFAGGEGAERETSDGFVIRIDKNGREVWKHLISGAGFQVGYHLQPFKDGSFLVIGYGAVDTKATPMHPSSGRTGLNHQAYVIRINAEGKVQYHNTFGGLTHDRATNALILKNENMIVAGQTQRPGAADEDSGWDMIVYVLNAAGTPVWSGRFGSEGVEFGRAVKGEANNLWILGHTTSSTGSNVLIVRMDASNVP